MARRSGAMLQAVGRRRRQAEAQRVVEGAVVTRTTTRPRLAAVKRPFRFKVRTFEEAREDEAVVKYCRKYVGAYGDAVIQVFASSASP